MGILYSEQLNHAFSIFPPISLTVVEYSRDLPRCYVVNPRQPNGRVLIAVHGISRGAVEQAKAWGQIAHKYGYTVIAPLFDQAQFGHFQTLNFNKGERTDAVLDRLLDEVGDQMGLETKQFWMSGYSGGAQFAHRYALINPLRVAGLVISAPGWFTYLDAKTPFPHGVKGLPVGSGNNNLNQLARFLEIPKSVFVGSLDTRTDSSFRRDKKLKIPQGRNRVTRAQAWVNHHRELEQQLGVNAQVRFRLLEGVAHSFSESVSLGALVEHSEWVFSDCPPHHSSY